MSVMEQDGRISASCWNLEPGRSLGSFDNAVAESTFKIIKAEFVSSRHLETLDQLQLELSDYAHWFNNIHLHGVLGYLSPVEFTKSRTL